MRPRCDVALLVAQSIAALVFNLLFYGGLLFGPAGTLAWPRAWVFLGVLMAASVASLFALRDDQGLIAERFKGPIQPGQPVADRVVLLLLIATYTGAIVFIPLDVFRLHVLPKPGPLVSATGLALFLVGFFVTVLALKANTFAAGAVRHQTERHHRVVDTGVYAVVRHPMYAGGIPFFVGLPLWLESYAAALLMIVPIALLVARILVEERFLCRELDGYVAYTRKTRYRLVPFVW